MRMCVTGGSDCVGERRVCGFIGRVLRCVLGSHMPTRAMMSHLEIVHNAASNATVYPASQNVWVEMSDACASPGMMCVMVASCGSHGISRLHVCVDCRDVLSISMMLMMGHTSFLMFMAWARPGVADGLVFWHVVT